MTELELRQYLSNVGLVETHASPLTLAVVSITQSGV